MSAAMEDVGEIAQVLRVREFAEGLTVVIPRYF